MKNQIARLFVALVLGLALCSPAFATNKSVTTVSAVASTILTPGSPTIITIQNTGSGDVLLGFDGGTTNRQKSTPDPTATTGYLLTAGSSVTMSIPFGTSVPQIRAILKTGTTTTLLVTTNDPFSV